MEDFRGVEHIWTECIRVSVPGAYIDGVLPRLNGGRGNKDAEVARLWEAGVPAPYAHALRSLPVTAVTAYWERGVRLERVQAYGLFASEQEAPLLLEAGGVPTSYSLPLLAEGLEASAIVSAYRDGIPFEYLIAAVQ